MRWVPRIRMLKSPATVAFPIAVAAPLAEL